MTAVPEPNTSILTAADEAALDRPRSGINLSGDVVTQATATLPEDQKLLIRWSFNYAKEQGFSWKQAESAFKLSTSTLSRVWRGEYGAQLDGVCKTIATAKKLAEERQTIPKLPFIETATWRKIAHVCGEVLASSSIGFIYGESQIGKTWSLKEYTRRNNHGQTVFVDTPTDGVQGLCIDIAEALHIGKSSFDRTFRRICDALDPDKLLIVDDLHVVFECYQKHSVARCLTLLRKIKDRTGCGLIVSATEVFATEAARSEFRNTMKQFFRRGTLTLQLGTAAPWEDVVAIAAHYKLALPEKLDKAVAANRREVDVLNLLRIHDGLGKITKYFAGAGRMAAKKKEPLTWAVFLRYFDITEALANGVAGEGIK